MRSIYFKKVDLILHIWLVLQCRRALELYIELSLILTVYFSRLYSLRVRHKISKIQVRGQIQGRVTHSSDSYTEERFETVSTPTLTEIHIR